MDNNTSDVNPLHHNQQQHQQTPPPPASQQHLVHQLQHQPEQQYALQSNLVAQQQQQQNQNIFQTSNQTIVIDSGIVISNGPDMITVNLPAPGIPQCTRHGCTNQAIVSPDWKDEYCSNECVIKHCEDIFRNWLQQEQQQQQQQI